MKHSWRLDSIRSGSAFQTGTAALLVSSGGAVVVGEIEARQSYPAEGIVRVVLTLGPLAPASSNGATLNPPQAELLLSRTAAAGKAGAASGHGDRGR